MNLLEIRTETRRILAEKSLTLSYVIDTDLNKFINEGIKDICIRGLIYEVTSTITVTTGVATYTLPYNFIPTKDEDHLISTIAVYNGSIKALTPIRARELGKVFISSGYPLRYFLTQTAISPATRAALTAYTINTLLLPAAVNGYLYEVTTAGTTGAGLPTYPTNPGTSVADGGATLTCRELFNVRWSLTLVDTPTTTGGGTGTYTLIQNAIDEGLYTDTDSPNFSYKYHQAIAYFTAFKVALKEKNQSLGVVFFQEYLGVLNLQLPPSVQKES